jgi:hypothetical protein
MCEVDKGTKSGDGARLARRERAIEALAKELHWKMEHLDPAGDADWAAMDEYDREYCRSCVKWLLLFPDHLRAAMGI